MNNSEFNELLASVFDNRATDEQRATLSETLRNSADARDEYLRYVDLHSALAEELVPSLESSIIDYRSGETLFGDVERLSQSNGLSEEAMSRFASWAVVVASLLLAVVGTWAIIAPNDGTTHSNPIASASSRVDSPSLATLALAKNCSWERTTLREGQHLSDGTYELRSGTALLRMSGGAEVAIVGPSRIELLHAGSARLQFGSVVVRASDDAEGFTLWTPNSEVVDLGTEFAVKVGDAGDTEVHVLDGVVEYRREKTPRPKATIMRAGDAIIARMNAEATEEVDLSSQRFKDLIVESDTDGPSSVATVEETFDYPVGVLPIGESNGGTGWDGPWRLRKAEERRNGQAKRDDEVSALKIVPSPDSPSRSLLMPAGFSCFVRPLENPIRLDRESITYLSVRFQQSDITPLETWIDAGIRITLRSSQDYFGRWICGGLNEQFQPYIQTGGGIGAKSPTVLSVTQPMTWVIKIVSRVGAGDSIEFRVFTGDEEITFSEPAAWHVAAHNIDLHSSLNRVLISCNGPNAFLVGELRIGPTWRSVVNQ